MAAATNLWRIRKSFSLLKKTLPGITERHQPAFLEPKWFKYGFGLKNNIIIMKYDLDDDGWVMMMDDVDDNDDDDNLDDDRCWRRL